MRKKRRFWTKEELSYLTENYETKNTKDIASKLGRTPQSILNKGNAIGLKRPTKPQWDQKELEYLRNNYGDMTAKKIGSVLGREGNSVSAKAYKLGLRKYRAEEKNTIYDLAKSGEIIASGTLKEIKAATGFNHKELSRFRNTQHFDEYALYSESEVI